MSNYWCASIKDGSLFISAHMLIKENYSTKFIKIADNVTLMSCGYDYVVYTENNTLYLFDKNSNTIKIADQVSDVSCGEYHCAYISNNSLFIMSSNRYKQLCIKEINSNRPVKIADQVSSVSCGNYHVAFIAKSVLYAIGNNILGQLGQGHDNPVTSAVKIANQVIVVKCEWYNTFYITADKQLWAAGDNSFGQLGQGHNNPITSIVKIADQVDSIIYASVVIIYQSDNKYFVCGRLKTRKYILSPTQIEEDEIKSLIKKN